MRDQNAVQAFKSQAGFHDLPLRAFAAVDQEAELFVHDELGGEAPVDGRR